MTFVDEMKNLLINDLDGIFFFFLKEINKNEVLSKVYCIKLNNQDNLMTLCENHLNVLTLASSKYHWYTDKGGVLIEKRNKHFCKGCIRSSCNKMAEFFVYKIFNYDYFMTGDYENYKKIWWWYTAGPTWHQKIF